MNGMSLNRAKRQRSISTILAHQAVNIVGNTFRRVSQWCNPSRAPNVLFVFKMRIDAVISVPIGAREAMLSYPNINEIKNVLHKIGTNPQTA